MGNVYHTLKERGFIAQVTDAAELEASLGRERVTCYIGFDPTASSLHAGSLLPLMALAHMQRAGHKTIAILGGGTAMVGDPSGKSEMRQMLTEEEISENGQQMGKQFARFIRVDGQDGLMLNNAEWLLPLSYISFLRDYGKYFSVNRMLSFEAYKIRLEKGLSFLEFNYQLLQAYDFLVLFQKQGCALQMGGDDQWGNIVAGMDLIRRLESKPAYGLTFPLLQTASGEKMGKTAKGAVWLDANRTLPYDFFQYLRNTDDRDVKRFLCFFTFLPLAEIEELTAAGGAALNAAKERLAYEVTKIVHGDQAAEQARAAAKSAFGGAGQGDEGIPSTTLEPARLGDGILVVDLFAQTGLCSSKSEARRLITQGGAKVGERKIESIEDKVTPQDFKDGSVILRAGKKKVHRVLVQD